MKFAHAEAALYFYQILIYNNFHDYFIIAVINIKKYLRNKYQSTLSGLHLAPTKEFDFRVVLIVEKVPPGGDSCTMNLMHRQELCLRN